mmetsp:Transcript_45206/g.124146  ORF Transcript_45206/g.124146 Transcript_45206/m.124146 type:complete len:216 (+) Transcript_45206:1672-2319(+)
MGRSPRRPSPRLVHLRPPRPRLSPPSRLSCRARECGDRSWTCPPRRPYGPQHPECGSSRHRRRSRFCPARATSPRRRRRDLSQPPSRRARSARCPRVCRICGSRSLRSRQPPRTVQRSRSRTPKLWRIARRKACTAGSESASLSTRSAPPAHPTRSPTSRADPRAATSRSGWWPCPHCRRPCRASRPQGGVRRSSALTSASGCPRSEWCYPSRPT